MYRVKKIPRKAAIAAAITAVALSDILSPRRGAYFCGVPRIFPQGSTFCCLTSGNLLIVDW
jgi:hypothetical protein